MSEADPCLDVMPDGRCPACCQIQCRHSESQKEEFRVWIRETVARYRARKAALGEACP